MKILLSKHTFQFTTLNLFLQNLVIILITLVNESDRDYLFITRLQYTLVIWDVVIYVSVALKFSCDLSKIP